MALMRLRAEDRLIIGYRYFFDLSEAEMAQALGVARGTVKSRLARALGRLRESFREVYPVVVAAPAIGAFVQESLGDLAAHLPGRSGGDLANTVLGRIAAGPGSGGQPASTPPASLVGPVGLAALALALVAAMVLAALQLVHGPSPPAAPPAGQKAVVYGADLAEAERQEVAQLLGVDGLEHEAGTVTREELVATLQAVGLPVAPTDAAVSSVALTSLESGHGLRVSTQHITRIPAAVYAHALLTARTIDGSVAIAAPSTRPVTGEAALVGVLKVASQCQGGKDADPARVRLAYEQLKGVAALAGEADDLSQASAVMLKVAQAVITGQATGEPSIGAALDGAAATEGLTIGSAQRAEAISLLGKLADVDYGPYGKSYEFHWLSPNEVEVAPATEGRR